MGNFQKIFFKKLENYHQGHFLAIMYHSIARKIYLTYFMDTLGSCETELKAFFNSLSL